MGCFWALVHGWHDGTVIECPLPHPSKPSITSATPTSERRQHGLNPMELDRLQGILCARNISLRFDTSLFFAHSEQETTMTKTITCLLVPGPPPRWILCKSMATTFTSMTSTLRGTKRRSSLSTPESRVQTRGSGC